MLMMIYHVMFTTFTMFDTYFSLSVYFPVSSGPFMQLQSHVSVLH